MEKFLQMICNVYRWVTIRIPLRLLHLCICFLTAIFSWELSVGLAIGRESKAMGSMETLRDSLGDLLADVIGISLGVTVRFTINFFR